MSGECQRGTSPAAQPPADARSSDAVVPDLRPHTWHLGLCDVPQPELLNPQRAKSLEKPQDAGTQLEAAGNSLDTALCPRLEHSPGSERSRDAAVFTTRSRQSQVLRLEQERPEGRQTASQPIRPHASLPADAAQRLGQSPKELKSSLPARDRIPADGLGSGGSKAAFAASMPGMSASHLEGSATSDENNQLRLVPRKGAGPDLRTQGGSKIDEYLMKLLRNGAPQPAADHWSMQDMGTGQQLGPSASGQSGQKPSPAVTWQGSRLGPLAPGAGVRSSAVSRKSAPAKVITEEAKPPASLSGLPPVPITKVEAGCEPQYEQPERRASGEAVPRRESGEAAAVVAGNAELRPAEEPACEAKDEAVQADAAGSVMQQRVQQMLGKGVWTKLKGTIENQSRQFQHQLVELHRVTAIQDHLQRQLNARAVGGAPGEGRPEVPSRHPPLFLQPTGQAGQAGAAAGVLSTQPTLAATPQGPSWWLGSFPSQAAGGSTASANPPQVQGEEAGRLSRTTQIALEAQRRRSKLRLAELSAQERAASRRAADQPASASGPSEGRPAIQQPATQHLPQQPQQQPPQLPWFSLMAPSLMQPSVTPLSRPLPPSSQLQASTVSAPEPAAGMPAAAPMDPLSAWYIFHFGQPPSVQAGGLGPTAAHYSMQLAGLAMAQSEGGWEKHCHKYFNFSLPASSEATGPNSKQDPAAPGWQTMSASAHGQKRSRSMALDDARGSNPSRAANHNNLRDSVRGREWEGGLAALENAARQVALQQQVSNRSPNGNSSGRAQRAN